MLIRRLREQEFNPGCMQINRLQDQHLKTHIRRTGIPKPSPRDLIQYAAIIDENVNSAALIAELQRKESGGVGFNTSKCANKW